MGKGRMEGEGWGHRNNAATAPKGRLWAEGCRDELRPPIRSLDSVLLVVIVILIVIGTEDYD
jgi:hypothetical protein